MSDIFNSLTFDDVNSLDHNVYITGESVYNAPERDVQAVEIPGRNGDYLLDKGRWKNIEVTYHCGTFGVDQTEFGSKIRKFRNQLASKRGYKRLVDTYNPNEYRMGTFINPVEVDAASMKRAGEFDVVFNCKPQRYLTSGETATTVANNGTLTNPTAYDASPLLAVKGYGTITFNGYSITVDNATMGEVVVANGSTVNVGTSVPINTTLFNRGDYLTVRNSSVTWGYSVGSFEYWDDVTVSGDFTARFSDNGHKVLYFSTPIVEWEQATNATSSITHTGTVTFNYYRNGVSTRSYSLTPTVTLSYNSSSNTITASISGYAITLENGMGYTEQVFEYSDITVNSSISILGNPTYIDCEIGEAYMIKSNEYVSLNRHIDLGSDLPTLKSGSNTFTKPSTITELKVTPRWWQL